MSHTCLPLLLSTKHTLHSKHPVITRSNNSREKLNILRQRLGIERVVYRRLSFPTLSCRFLPYQTTLWLLFIFFVNWFVYFKGIWTIGSITIKLSLLREFAWEKTWENLLWPGVSRDGLGSWKWDNQPVDLMDVMLNYQLIVTLCWIVCRVCSTLQWK